MPGFLGHAEARAGVALRIEVDHEHALANSRQSRAKIDCCCRLAHAALLIGDREDPKAVSWFLFVTARHPV